VKFFGARGKIIHTETEAGGVGELKEVHSVFTFKKGADVEKILNDLATGAEKK
jgi:hypothetical protein